MRAPRTTAGIRAPAQEASTPSDILSPADAAPDPEEPMVMDGPFIETKELAL
jgi:hypothetical protein